MTSPTVSLSRSRRWLLLVSPLLIACSDGASSPPPETGETAILDPALFDCSAASIPERASTTPVACGLDVSCLTPQVAAHRGAGGQLGKLAPEDTLAAYRAGIAIGVDYVETDPRPTLDGVLVNIHDTSVDRTTDGSGIVDEMTYAEVAALQIDATGFAGDFSCERVPTLEEVLATCKGRVIVLVDANKTDRVDLLVAAIQNTDTIDWAIFDTSSVEKIDEALLLEPTLHTMIRVDDAAQAESQLDHFAAHPPIIVEVDSAAPLAETAVAIHSRNNRVFTDVFVHDFVAGLNDDPSYYAETFSNGADIVQTDRPDLVLEYLGRR